MKIYKNHGNLVLALQYYTEAELKAKFENWSSIALFYPGPSPKYSINYFLQVEVVESLVGDDDQDADNMEPASEREDRMSERSEHEQSEQPQPDHDEGQWYHSMQVSQVYSDNLVPWEYMCFKV